MANQHFYPEIEPYKSGMMPVDDIHTIYWEECGNPDGEPILFIHGGPGAGATETDRRFFDPSYFRIVLFDQRGTVRSTPQGETQNNSIDDLVRDIEQLRTELGIKTWHVFGGSWGSTLSLYYSQECPSSCRTLTIRGIWLLRDEEIQWWLYGMRLVQPERWKVFSEHLPVEDRDDLLEGYWKKFHSEDRDEAREAARIWSVYEGASCTLLPNPEFEAFFHDLDKAWCTARLEAHYFRNVRLDPDDLLLQRVDTIRHIPTFIVHGRYDIVCPVASAVDLHALWPESSLVIVPDAGHSSHEPGITKELVAATNRIRDKGTPTL
ncbi:MAG: prolyl aminopeptidase [Bacteroidetes Order II. Incertae sedis bacterium]|jgi:proline iminopeptidase|nr:prolyl aminopeptidase [Bacteroidetes Order II. bacterium]MDG1755334.1 prolyl aminopeptidase [Rhodothermales bacterium]HAY36202.1 prolyl aminopeptidase [Bacteroidota bacterium]MBT4603249.1 prolyl aminopeptidase [Bacteroidetes Order II. bacterium]MBT5250909.1 prolyl aminopeptidase [Bacteroidetes Order II. bacterium]